MMILHNGEFSQITLKIQEVEMKDFMNIDNRLPVHNTLNLNTGLSEV